MTNPFLGSISPSASILDPMGYTQTSFLDPSPVSSRPRPATLLGTYASAFNDAGGFISFARSSPAQAPWDPLGLTSEAADDGDPSYDPRLLSLITPETAGDGDVDPVLAYYQKEAAKADAVDKAEVEQIGTPRLSILGTYKYRIGAGPWKPGRELASGIHLRARTVIWLDLGPQTRTVMLTFVPNSNAPGGVTWSSNTNLAHEIPGTRIVTRSNLTSILLPNAIEGTKARQALHWAKSVPYLGHLIPKDRSNSAEGKALLHHHGVYLAGAKILEGRELPRIVANGASYSRQTFFGALVRLGMTVSFQHIANLITREAKGRYSSLADLVVTDNLKSPRFLGSSHNLTAGTAALAGFIYSYGEVVGHRGLAIVGSNGKWLRNNEDFSMHVRRALVYWGNALTIFPRYTGNFKSHVQASARKVAELVNLHHFFDGKNDPWSGSAIYEPSHPRGRELVENRDNNPRLPFGGFGGPNADDYGRRVAEILSQIDRVDIRALTHRAYVEFRRENPALLGVGLRRGVADETRAIAWAELTPLIIDLVLIPGVVVRVDNNNPVNEEQFRFLWDTYFVGLKPENTLVRALDEALGDYIADPTEQDNEDNLNEVWGEVERYLRRHYNHVLTARDFRIIVNTLILGGEDAPVGNALLDDPYWAVAQRYEAAAVLEAQGRIPETYDELIGRWACERVEFRDYKGP